jgi:hypothetical protein
MSTLDDALEPFRIGWSADVIREDCTLDDFDDFEEMVESSCDGQRISSAIAVVKLEDGSFRMIAFRPTEMLVTVAAANAAEFAIAAWEAHGCPITEEAAIVGGKRLAAQAVSGTELARESDPANE